VPSKRIKTKKGSVVPAGKSSGPVPVFALGLPIKTIKSRMKSGGIKLVRVWGFNDDAPASLRSKNTRVRRIRNPWIPNDIVQLLTFLSLSYPVSKAFVEIVKAWMQSRGAEEVTIKAQGKKLTIKGHMSQLRIKKILDEFNQRIDGFVHEDIKVTIPKGVKRSIPKELTTVRKESK
jgi:hypothetical protein